MDMKILVIKPAIDKRYSDNKKVVTHNLDSIDCEVCSKLDSFEKAMIEKYQIIAIDEGQFFDDLKRMVLYWVETLQKKVIISGLDGDYQRKPIGQLLELLPYADSFTKHTAFCSVCKDGTPGLFSKRIVKEGETVVIGGADKYMAVCRKHY